MQGKCFPIPHTLLPFPGSIRVCYVYDTIDLFMVDTGVCF
jgi:hypothetical protein